MTKGLPRWFCALFTVVMLALCGMLVFQLMQQQSAQLQIVDLQNKIETSEKRLLKQQAEHAEYIAKLPLVEAELAEAAPQAEAAAARVAELKEQRKTLRAENESLKATLRELEEQSAAVNAKFNADTKGISEQLDQAIQSLTELLATLEK